MTQAIINMLYGAQLCVHQYKTSGADPGFLLGGGAPLRNDVTIQDFSREGCTSKE